MGAILEAVLKQDRPIGVGDTGPTVRLIQEALQRAGHQIVIDGEYGPITEGAVKMFQAANGLTPLGFVGAKTAAALDDLLAQDSEVRPPNMPSTLRDAPWLARMRSITGTKEVPGKANSPIIMSWRSDITKALPEVPGMARYCASYTGDSIPWCGYCEGWCMAMSNIVPPFGTKDTDKFMWADAWSRWGTKLTRPITGCIMVFSRAGGGHVSTLERLDGNTAYIRGGNQSDMVNVAPKTMQQFTAAVWPKGWSIPAKPISPDVSNVAKPGSEA